MKKSQKKAIAIGAGVAAVAAAAAGTYLFAGKRGAKNRAKIGKWIDTAKKDITKELNKVGKLTKENYNKTVDKVLAEYKNLKQLDKSEIILAAQELKKQWDITQGQIKKAAKPVLKKITGGAKKPASKPASKSKPKKK